MTATVRIAVRYLDHSMVPTAAALLGVALIAAVPVLSRAETSDASAGAPDWETVNRVLEIPQVCASDGGFVTCKSPDMDLTDGGGAGAARSDNASTEEVSSVDDADGAPGWGTLQDYEDQGAGSGPVTAYMAARAAINPPRTYAAPIRPLVPPVLAHSTARRAAIFRPGTSPWMLPPRMATGPAATPLVIPGRRGLPCR